MNDDQQTLYDIFDLEHNATGAQILARYRLLRDELLAEGIPYDDPQFATLNDAYRILSDTVKRAEYDDELKAEGVYHAVERVDERTSLADLFELDDDELFEPETITEQKQPYPQPQPLLSIKFDPNRAERIREFKTRQQSRLLLTQPKENVDQPKKRRQSVSKFTVFLLVFLPVTFITLINGTVIILTKNQIIGIVLIMGFYLTIIGMPLWLKTQKRITNKPPINTTSQQHIQSLQHDDNPFYDTVDENIQQKRQ